MKKMWSKYVKDSQNLKRNKKMTTLIELRSELEKSVNKMSAKSASHCKSLLMGEISMIKSSGERVFDGFLGINLCHKSAHLIPLIRESVDSHENHYSMSVIETDAGYSVTIFLSCHDEFNESLFCDISFITGVKVDSSCVSHLEMTNWIPQSDFNYHKEVYEFQKFEEKCLFSNALGLTIN